MYEGIVLERDSLQLTNVLAQSANDMDRRERDTAPSRCHGGCSYFSGKSRSICSWIERLYATSTGLQNLQNRLNSGDSNGAESAFQTLQQLSQGLTTGSGTSSSTTSQLHGSHRAQEPFEFRRLGDCPICICDAQGRLKNAGSPSRTLQTSIASQSEQLVSGLLNSLNTSGSSPSASDNTTSVLSSVYGSSGSLNVFG
jgi:hypothetical protein